jgi:hypothetical protein
MVKVEATTVIDRSGVERWRFKKLRVGVDATRSQKVTNDAGKLAEVRTDMPTSVTGSMPSFFHASLYDLNV